MGEQPVVRHRPAWAAKPVLTDSKALSAVGADSGGLVAAKDCRGRMRQTPSTANPYTTSQPAAVSGGNWRSQPPGDVISSFAANNGPHTHRCACVTGMMPNGIEVERRPGSPHQFSSRPRASGPTSEPLVLPKTRNTIYTRASSLRSDAIFTALTSTPNVTR